MPRKAGDASTVLSSRNIQGRKQRIWEMYTVEGYTQQEIAEHFGLAQPTVWGHIHEWARKVDELPRETIVKARRQQIDAKISQLEELFATAPPAMKIAISAEIRKWFELRGRFFGEIAPAKIQVPGPDGTGEPVTYQIDFPAPEGIRKALS